MQWSRNYLESDLNEVISYVCKNIENIEMFSKDFLQHGC